MKCPTCGAQVDVAAGEMEGTCAYCHVPVRRMARTGDPERAYARQVMEKYGAPALPAEGVPGYPVTPENREGHVLNGLAREAQTYAALIAPERFLSTVRKSFPRLTDPERAQMLEKVEAIGRTQGETPDSKRLFAEARRLLRAAKPTA